MPPVEDERKLRLDVWSEIRPLSEAGQLEAAAVNESRSAFGGLRIFYGGRGVWTDKARTGALAPDGVTVGVLHTGRSYADDLQSDGIVYHYPRTTVPGRDAQEVNATKAARELGLPLFVVVQPDATSRRVVHLGWVEEWDDAGELFLITFAGSQPASLPSLNQEDELPFDLERESDTSRKGSRLSRPGQSRFNFLVFRRYGTECAVCAVSTKALLDAAHLRAHRDRGTNDPRNGLVLCATHHRALDNHLFGVEPESGVVMVKDGLTLETLGITKKTLEHLPARPHAAALEWCWSKFHPARRQARAGMSPEYRETRCGSCGHVGGRLA